MKKLIACLAVALFLNTPAYAFDEAAAKELATSKIAAWLNTPTVVDAVKAQNEKHAALDEAGIKALDERWKGGDASLVDPVLGNDLSTYLKKVVADGGGLYTEIFVMDNKGLNVGQSDKTSDYWQGDEDKWSKTFSVGADAVHISEVEFDESTQTYQVQLSLPVNDGGAPVGAVTIGLNAEMLK
ncbi:MAG: PDC sensor domain-containing protein [Micavibrio sp.]